MTRGGKRVGAGRRKGTPNKASIDRQKKIAASGITPLEYMLKVMRNSKVDASRRDEMAKACAPYVHPRLATTAHTGPKGGPVQIADVTRLKGMTEEELEVLERALVQIGLTEGDTSGTGEPEE